MTSQGIERLKMQAAAAVQAATTFRRLAGQYRAWGDAPALSEAHRLENLAAWHDARAKIWGATA